MKIGIYARGLSVPGGVKTVIESITENMINIIKEEDELFIFHNLEQNYFASTRSNVHEIIMHWLKHETRDLDNLSITFSQKLLTKIYCNARLPKMGLAVSALGFKPLK